MCIITVACYLFEEHQELRAAKGKISEQGSGWIQFAAKIVILSLNGFKQNMNSLQQLFMSKSNPHDFYKLVLQVMNNVL